MKKKLMRGSMTPMSWLVIGAQLVAPFSVHANVADRSVGILGGVGSIGDAERTYEILEKRLQRWLEDSVHQQMRIAAVAGSESEHRTQLELERLQLQQASEELLKATAFHGKVSTPVESLYEKVRSLAERLWGVKSFGPELQLAGVALAAYSIRFANKKAAADFIRRAKALHPEGKLAAILPWIWERHPEREAVESLWAGIVDEAHSCRLSWTGSGMAVATHTLHMNGFVISYASVAVVPGRTFSLSVTAGGETLSTQNVSCSGPGSRVVRLESPSVFAWGWDEARKTALARISERHSVATLLVLDKAGEEYNIYVFTPGLALDRVPLKEPLRADTIRASQKLPIEWTGLKSLLDKHQRQSARLALSESAVTTSSPSSLALERMTVSDPEPAWYERSTTWILLGAVATGIAVAVLANRSSAPVQSGSGFAIQLD